MKRKEHLKLWRKMREVNERRVTSNFVTSGLTINSNGTIRFFFSGNRSFVLDDFHIARWDVQ